MIGSSEYPRDLTAPAVRTVHIAGIVPVARVTWVGEAWCRANAARPALVRSWSDAQSWSGRAGIAVGPGG